MSAVQSVSAYLRVPQRRQPVPLRGDWNISEDEQRRRGVEARQRLMGAKPKPLLMPLPPVVSQPAPKPITSTNRMVPLPPSKRMKAWQIIGETGAKHGVSVVDIRSKSRFREIAFARHECCYRLRAETELSLGQIANILGGIHHTTALSGMRAHAGRHDLPEIDKDDDSRLVPKATSLMLHDMRESGLTYRQIGERTGFSHGKIVGIIVRHQATMRRHRGA